LTRMLPRRWAVPAWIGAIGVALWCLVDTAEAPRGWVVTQWLFSWEYGFVKRGFPGEIVRWLEPHRDHLTLAAAGILTTAAGVLALVVRFLGSLRGALRHPGAPVFAAFTLAHFATIPNMVADAGRFDHIGVAAFVAALALISACTERNRSPGPFLLPMLVAGLLTHEAWLFIFIPSIFAAWWFASADRGSEARGFDFWIPGVGAAVLIVLGFIARFGSMSTMDLPEHHEKLRSGVDFSVDLASLRVLHDPLRDTVEHTWRYLRHVETLWDHLILLVAFMPTIALVVMAAGAAARLDAPGGRLRRRIIVLAPLTSLALYPIGHDFVRWLALAALISLVLIAWRMRVPEVRDAVLRVFARFWWLAVISVVITVVMGEVGIYYAFPARFIESWLESPRAFR